MKFVDLTAYSDKILPFYLAAEEWVADKLPAGEYFFAWQVDPTVICGRNQLMHKEVDLDYCKEHSIRVFRRKSGGGCVYADRNNIMFSYIKRTDESCDRTLRRYAEMIATMLRSLGLAAEPTGRNDVAIRGSKVAGNAFYFLRGCSIAHGTMLYDADFETLSKVLTPSRAKLEEHCVKSVPSRVTTLRKEGLKIGLNEFIDHVIKHLCDEEPVRLGEAEKEEIEAIMQSYLRSDFYFDRDVTECNYANTQRFEGVGEVTVYIKTDRKGVIEEIIPSGDFFPCGDEGKVLKGFVGQRIGDVIAPSSTEIENLRPEQLTNLINGAKPRI